MFLALPVVLFQEACLDAAVKMLRSGAEYGNVDNDERRSKNGSSESESNGWTDRWGRLEHIGMGGSKQPGGQNRTGAV